MDTPCLDSLIACIMQSPTLTPLEKKGLESLLGKSALFMAKKGSIEAVLRAFLNKEHDRKWADRVIGEVLE